MWIRDCTSRRTITSLSFARHSHQCTWRRLLMTSRVLHGIQLVHLARCSHQIQLGLRAFSKKSIAALDAANDGTKKPRPKTVRVPKITLISPDNSMTITLLEEAQHLAKRRNLFLTKITDLDSKTQRAVYKLVNNLDQETEKTNVEDSDKNKHRLKDTKILYVSAKIARHDLTTKMNNVIKWLGKGHRVKLIITLDETHEIEMRKIVEDLIKDHGDIQIMPTKKNVNLLVITPRSNNDALVAKRESGANDQIAKNT